MQLLSSIKCKYCQHERTQHLLRIRVTLWSHQSLYKTHIKFHRSLVLPNPKCAMRVSHVFQDLLKNQRGLFLIWFDFLFAFFCQSWFIFSTASNAHNLLFIYLFVLVLKKGTFNNAKYFRTGKKLCNFCQLMFAGDYQSNPPLVEGRSRRL